MQKQLQNMGYSRSFSIARVNNLGLQGKFQRANVLYVVTGKRLTGKRLSRDGQSSRGAITYKPKMIIA